MRLFRLAAKRADRPRVDVSIPFAGSAPDLGPFEHTP